MPWTNAADDTGAGKRNSSDTTQRLLDAAVVEFGERGFEAARVADIARRSELTTGAIYSRWRDKRELFVAAVEYAMAKHLAAHVRVGEGASEMSLASFGTNLLKSAENAAKSLLLEACVVARRDSALKACIAQALNAEAEGLSAIVTECKAAGILDGDLPTEVMVLCYQALDIGVQLALTLSGDRTISEIAPHWDDLVKRVMASWAPLETDPRLEG